MNHYILPPNSISQKSISNHEPIHASSCGKSIIVGEHAVIYGSSAVAIPVSNLRMRVSLRYSHTKSALKLGHKKVSDHVLGVIEDAFQALEIESFPCQIEGTSELLIGSGLGSSAALSVVILKVLASSVGRKISSKELTLFGKILEGRFHGRSSGLDTCVVAYEKPILFNKNSAPQILEIGRKDKLDHWHFALVNSGTRSSTQAMINLAAPYFLDRKKSDMRLAQFEVLAQSASEALKTYNCELLADSMNIASQMLAEAGLVSDLLKGMLDQIKSIGIPAAKLTGAGGGGCILTLLCPNKFENQFLKLQNLFGKNNVYSIIL